MSKQNNDFPEWEELDKFIINDHRPKKMEKKLIEAARKWLPYALKGRHGTASYGDYLWTFCVKLEQERIWNFPEFSLGMKYGITSRNPSRDANPYNERSRHRSWDCGYILGLEKKRS